MRIEITNELLASDIPESLQGEIRSFFTIPNPVYVDAKKFGRYTGNISPTLELFRESGPNAISVPRGAARDVFAMAKPYGKIDLDDRRITMPEISPIFSGTLRPYQQQAVDGILAKDFGVLEAGTGSGKTVNALATIAARRQPTLILVHTKELLYQWRDRIFTFLNTEAGLIGAGKKDIRPISVAIVNSARNHLEELTGSFGYLIVDECHRVPSSLFTDVVSQFPCKYMLGLSATPYRRDGLDKVIGWYMGLHRTTVKMAVLHQAGAVLRPKVVQRQTGFDFFYNDDYQDLISSLVANEQRNALVAGDIQQQAKAGGLSLVVSDRVEHLKKLASMVDAPLQILTGETPIKKRREIVNSLSSGEIRTLFSTLSLIGEGFDCPDMDAVFLSTPIKFSGRLKQVVGRVLRPVEGKTPTVYDYVDSRVGILKYQAQCRKREYASM